MDILAVCALVWMAASAWSLELQSDLERLMGRPTHCSHSRAYGMVGANCAELRLKTVPQDLRTSIEILDLTDNKIRELQKLSFSSYPSLKFLYLADNSIHIIEKDTFSSLRYLETLDLSSNSLSSIPDTLFQMPSLRRLILADNTLPNLKDDLKNLHKPMKAPIELLDLSICRLKDLPDLGSMPELIEYNISGNPLQNIELSRFAQTCELSILDVSGSLWNISSCKLKAVVDWLRNKNVSLIQTKNYKAMNFKENDQCLPAPPPNYMHGMYKECKVDHINHQGSKQSKILWLIIFGSVVAIFLLIVAVLYALHRRKILKTKRTKLTLTPKSCSTA